MPLIILEGADGSGKSTLAKALIDHHDGTSELWHEGPPPANRSIKAIYETPITTGYPAPSKQHLIVCDRWHLGELVYGPLFRGKSRLTLVERMHLEMYLNSLGAIMVHVHVSDHLRARRLTQRGDDMVNVEQAKRIADRYKVFLASSQLPVLHLNGGGEAHQLADVAHRRAMLHSQRALELQRRGVEYIGDHDPEILIVACTTESRTPPFSPYQPGVNEWLMRAVYELNRHRRVGIVAARSGHHLLGLYDDLGQPRCVALGSEGSRILTQAKIKHGKVSHPQYAHRARRHPEDFAQLIRNASTTLTEVTF